MSCFRTIHPVLFKKFPDSYVLNKSFKMDLVIIIVLFPMDITCS